MLKLGLKGFFAYYHKILSISCKDRLVLLRSKVNHGVREACIIPLYHPSLRLLSESCLWSQRIQRSLHCVKPLLVPCCPSEVQNQIARSVATVLDWTTCSSSSLVKSFMRVKRKISVRPASCLPHSQSSVQHANFNHFPTDFV